MFTELEMTMIIKSSARRAKDIQLTREKQIQSVTNLPGSLLLLIPFSFLTETVKRFSHRADITVVALDMSINIQSLQVYDHVIFTSSHISDFAAFDRVHAILQQCVRPATTVHILLSNTEENTLHGLLLNMYDAKENLVLNELHEKCI
jgi:hypothetical protein